MPIEHIHLIGISGSAMAALAGMLKERGYHVTGSDTGVYPPASTFLQSLGIPFHATYSEENLKPQPDLVVIANAISRGNPEAEYVLDQKIPYRSMPEILKEFFLPGHTSIVIAGTHGKTTTTSMLAWILQVAARKPNFLIGGIAENFGRSYGLGGGEEFALEGDEYDTAFFDKGPKFLHYRPDELIITSLEFDHADIYPDLASIETQFRRLVNLVPRRGRIVAWGESTVVRGVVSRAFCPIETYGLSNDCDWIAGDIEFRDAATHFRVARRGSEIARVQLSETGGVGRISVLNALAAIALAHGRGVPAEAIEEAMRTFRSARRRMEVKAEVAGVMIVDDFAHHPTAIRETIRSARQRWPGRRLWAVIEPRSNTMRRKIFEGILPDALADADAVIFGPVHRAHLLADQERLSPARVVDQLRRMNRSAEAFDSAAAVADYLARECRSGDVVLIMSNGSFDNLHERVAKRLETR